MSMDISPTGVLKIAEGAFADNADKGVTQNPATLKQILESWLDGISRESHRASRVALFIGRQPRGWRGAAGWARFMMI